MNKRSIKKYVQNKKGITLVSLVVTIVVLIILAGVSISATLGENGIITIAKQAKENIEQAQIQEQTELNELYTQIDMGNSGGISYDAIAKLIEFKRKIAQAITNNGVITNESDTVDTMVTNIGKIASKAESKIIEFKRKIAQAITNKGVTTNESDTIDTMVTNIGKIKDKSDLNINLYLKGVYNSYGAGQIFYYNNKDYKYLKYQYGGYCGCIIKGDGTPIVSIGSTVAPNNITKAETIDISNYSIITVEQNTIGYTSAGLNLIFTNTP